MITYAQNVYKILKRKGRKYLYCLGLQHFMDWVNFLTSYNVSEGLPVQVLKHKYSMFPLFFNSNIHILSEPIFHKTHINIRPNLFNIILPIVSKPKPIKLIWVNILHNVEPLTKPALSKFNNNNQQQMATGSEIKQSDKKFRFYQSVSGNCFFSSHRHL